MIQSKNLKLKLGLCGLALTSFLALNSRSVVHADTVSGNNADAITWYSDQDDSQVVHEDSNQSQPTQNVQAQVPAVQKQQVAQAAQPKQSAVQSAPVQDKAVQPAQKQTTVQTKQWQVAVSNVSSTVSAPNRAERSTVRQSSVQTSTVNHLNANTARNNQVNASVKVSNVNSDAQMPVQTQVIAKLSNKAKTYAISIPTVERMDMPMAYSGHDVPAHDGDSKAWSHDGWIYNGQYYKDEKSIDSALDSALGGDVSKSFTIATTIATVNPQFTMNGTEFLTDTGITYNNHRLGVLIIPKFTEIKQPQDNDGYLSTYPAGFLPALSPHTEWTGSQYTVSEKDWHMTYSYTAVPIDMNTGQTISGVSIDGTATKETNIQTYLTTQVDEHGQPSDIGGYETITPFSDTTVTGGTVSSDQSLVSPYIKPMLDAINAGKIKPYQSDTVDWYPVSGDHGGSDGLFNHYNIADHSIKDNGQDSTRYKYMDSTVIPYTQNLFYLALKTRQVNPDNPNAKKQAKRIIHLNFPNGVRPDSYNNIVDKDNNVVQTVTFTRSGTENLADGSVKWGPWQGNGKFAPVTLPGIPGYTMVTTK